MIKEEILNGYVIETTTKYKYISKCDPYYCCVHCSIREEEDQKEERSKYYQTTIYLAVKDCSISYVGGFSFDKTRIVSGKLFKKFGETKEELEAEGLHLKAIEYVAALKPRKIREINKGVVAISHSTGGISLSSDTKDNFEGISISADTKDEE